ncbi:hypothetical protein QQF64_021388 [Cirrhinus molitorella]|uniref:G-protein coupled receptors family 1 profile domain-containing protein n=1 Tax=Cirrhinus molitorella TaxID=172907 RepID=A0ABR3LFT3_9TELE
MLEETNISTCRLSIFARNSSECLSVPFPFVAFSISTNLLLGFPAHCYILWLIMKEMIRGQSLKVFFFNTSLAEVVFNLAYVFLIKQYLFHCSNCRSVALGFGLFLLVSRPLFQTCICVERYVGVLHAVTFLKFKPIKYRIIISIIGWILIVCSCLLSITGVVDMFDFLLPQYLAFFTTKVFTCLMVLKALRRPGPSDDVKQRDRVNRDKVKAFRIIQIVLVSSVLTDHVRVCAASPLSQKS